MYYDLERIMNIIQGDSNNNGLIVITKDNTFEFDNRDNISCIQEVINDVETDYINISQAEEEMKIHWPHIAVDKYNYVILTLSSDWIVIYLPYSISKYQFEKLSIYNRIFKELNNNSVNIIAMHTDKKTNGLDEELSSIEVIDNIKQR